jgi:hypothetical protein
LVKVIQERIKRELINKFMQVPFKYQTMITQCFFAASPADIHPACRVVFRPLYHPF